MKNTPAYLFAGLVLVALAFAATAQQLAPAPVSSTPIPLTPVPAPVAPVAPAAAPEAASAPAPANSAPRLTGGMINSFNFQGASLKDVLNYLSDAAGFVIVQEVPITGTVNIVSRQPIGAEDAVDLLNSVLAEKGFTAIRNGRILKIVNRKDAKTRDLPVEKFAEVARIPRDDAVVTEILPLRFGEAAKVIENLRPLLSDNATVSANEASNAIIMTDTHTNIRRIAQILQALDDSVSSISTITVFPLEFADSKAVAETITQLFSTPSTTTNGGGGGRGGRGGGFGGFGGFFGGGGGPGGGGGQAASPQSEARIASTKVVAVADEQSNSVIVSSPEPMVEGIRELIKKIDVSINDVTQTKIFALKHADAVETADILTNLFPDTANQRSRTQGQNNSGRGGRGFGGGGGEQTNNSAQSERSLLQSKVVAVGDPRTNTLLVTAADDTMQQIVPLIARLDQTEAKKQHVYVIQLKTADADNVAGVLRGLINGDTTGASQSTAQSNSTLGRRQTTGASSDTTLSSSGSSSGNNSSGRSSR